MEPCAVQSLDLLREVEDTSILRTGYLAPRKLGMHRNNQDNDGLQLVFGPCRLQLLAGLEHGRSIPSPDTARNLGFIFPRNARMGPMEREGRGGKGLRCLTFPQVVFMGIAPK